VLQEPGQDGVLPLSLRSIPANQWAHLCGRRVSSNSERGPFFLSCARLAWMPFFLFFESRLSVLRIGLCHWACYIVGKHWPCTHALACGRSTWVGPGRRFGSDAGGGIAASLLFGACISTFMDQRGVGGPLDREVCMYIPCLPWTMFVCVSSTLCSLPPLPDREETPSPPRPCFHPRFPSCWFRIPLDCGSMSLDRNVLERDRFSLLSSLPFLVFEAGVCHRHVLLLLRASRWRTSAHVAVCLSLRG